MIAQFTSRAIDIPNTLSDIADMCALRGKIWQHQPLSLASIILSQCSGLRLIHAAD